MRLRSILCLPLFALLPFRVEAKPIEPVAPGVIVETVAPESAGFRAGLMPGDRLFSWCRRPAGEDGCAARGDLRTPFDWIYIQMEEIQRGGVVVEGARGPDKLRWSLLPTLQGITVAPLLEGPLAEIYRSASTGEDLVRAAELAAASQCPEAALWLRAQAAQLHAKARQWAQADSEYQKALTQVRALGSAAAESRLLMLWSEALSQRGDVLQARLLLDEALALEVKENPEGLGVATVLIRQGNLLERQDQLNEAEQLYRRASGLILRVASGTGAEAVIATNLAVITGTRGDLAQAEQYAARALGIREGLTPAGDAIIPSLLGYGILLYARGDFAGAEAAFLRARKIQERVQPESVALATTLHNLGELAYERGDHDAADDLFRRELALFEKIDPSGTLVRDSLIGLGEVALRQGQGDKAGGWWRRALAISQKINSTGPKIARCLSGLAAAERLQGRSAEAEGLLRQALAIWQTINPEAHHTGSAHLTLGLLLFEQGKTEEAETHLRTAIRVHAKEGRPLPEGYQALARLQARKDRHEEAAATYLAAILALEDQRLRLGGAQESQWLYGSTLGDLYFEAAEHQIAHGRTEEAWGLIERGRARGFQEMLTRRDLRLTAEIPLELYIERRRLATEYDAVQGALADWVPEQGDIETLLGRLRDLRSEQSEVQARILRSSPRLGALVSPAPLDLQAARGALDPGTVLLTYAVGEARSYLFVLAARGASGPALSLYPLAIGREDLQQEVEAFRRLAGRRESSLPALRERGRHLYDLLIRPAEPALRRADRWLISPDGPLHILPFAALQTGDRYLAEIKPLHFAASAAVYREIREAHPEAPAAATELLAVGDPLYPARLAARDETDTDPQVRSALRRGLQLGPLPSSRREVEAISSLFPGVRLLGGDATEEAIKFLAPRARRIHFACHGLLDQRFPLNSGLALSIPEHLEAGHDNGLLQAWEIMEELRLDADLVTLSACDSGLGQEMGGEGLVGLVRAFQFAGARSVLASLWSVDDASTADLMQHFYSYLRQGRTKDEALRSAQIDLISARAALAHPSSWAGFTLSGDWR